VQPPNLQNRGSAVFFFQAISYLYDIYVRTTVEKKHLEDLRIDRMPILIQILKNKMVA
jgi:hypothetical protein